MKSIAMFTCILLAFTAPVPAQEPTVKSIWDKDLELLDTFVADGTMSLSLTDDDGEKLIREVDFHWEKDGINFFAELRRTASLDVGVNRMEEIIPYKSTIVGNSETFSGFDFFKNHPLGGTGFISPRKRNYYPNQYLLVAFDLHSGVKMFFPSDLTELVGSTNASSITREPIKASRNYETFIVTIDPITHLLVRTDTFNVSNGDRIMKTTRQAFFPDTRRPKSLRHDYFKKGSATTTCRLEFTQFELIKPSRKFELTESEKIPNILVNRE